MDETIILTRTLNWFNKHSPKNDNLGSANCDDQMSSFDDHFPYKKGPRGWAANICWN